MPLPEGVMVMLSSVRSSSVVLSEEGTLSYMFQVPLVMPPLTPSVLGRVRCAEIAGVTPIGAVPQSLLAVVRW